MCDIFFLHFKDEEVCKWLIQGKVVTNKTAELELLNPDAMSGEVWRRQVDNLSFKGDNREKLWHM